MLRWELIDTPLASGDEVARLPSEPELIAIMIALLAVESLTYTELSRRVLRLTDETRERVANFLITQLPMFREVLGSEQELRKRLAELTGIAVTDA